jgi:capsular exopolysaccharide synthesis family protein
VVLGPLEYWTILRRRWLLVACVVIAGVVAAAMITPSKGFASTEYRATNTLLVADDPTASVRGLGRAGLSLGSLRSLVTSNEVATRVAQRIGYHGDVAKLANHLSLVTDPEASTIAITATEGSAADAVTVADTFAQELIGQLDDTATSARDANLAELDAQIKELRARLTQLESASTQRTPSARAVVAERNAVSRQFSEAVLRRDQFASQALPSDRLKSVQKAEAQKVTSGLAALKSTSGRVGVAGLLGLLLGSILALVVDRTDTRIRTKEQAEGVFDAPVLAEIPVLRSDEQFAAVQPHSHGAEAFRALRASLLLMRGEADAPDEDGDDGPGTILVTSGNPSEGKTTTACNLAASFGETGRRVLLVDCDFRHPRVEKTFDIEPGPGLSDVLVGRGRPSLHDVAIQTDVAMVTVVTAGSHTENPAEAFAQIGPEFLEEARKMADIVIIDTPPLLAITDTSELVPFVDAVLVACRAGQTSASSGLRTAELLARLGAPFRGVVLVGAKEGPTSKGYYYDYYRNDGGNRRGRRGRRTPPPPRSGKRTGSTRQPQTAPSARGRGRSG